MKAIELVQCVLINEIHVANFFYKKLVYQKVAFTFSTEFLKL